MFRATKCPVVNSNDATTQSPTQAPHSENIFFTTHFKITVQHQTDNTMLWMNYWCIHVFGSTCCQNEHVFRITCISNKTLVIYCFVLFPFPKCFFIESFFFIESVFLY